MPSNSTLIGLIREVSFGERERQIHLQHLPPGFVSFSREDTVENVL